MKHVKPKTAKKDNLTMSFEKGGQKLSLPIPQETLEKITPRFLDRFFNFARRELEKKSE